MFGVFRRQLSVFRKPSGEYVDGVWQPYGDAEKLTITASVQPTSPEDIELLQSGKRKRRAYTLYSDVPFQMADDNKNIEADRVEIDGEMFEIEAVQNWQNSIIPHCKSVAVLESEQ